jgi:hypothetical protein
MGRSGESVHTGAEGDGQGEVERGDELLYSEVDEGLFEKRKENKFLFKLDVCLMSWAWLAYLIKVRSSPIVSSGRNGRC